MVLVRFDGVTVVPVVSAPAVVSAAAAAVADVPAPPAVSMKESLLSVVSCSMAEVTPLPLSMLVPLAGLAGCNKEDDAGAASGGPLLPPGSRRSMSTRPNWQPTGRVSSLQRASSTVLSHTRLVYSLARDPST